MSNESAIQAAHGVLQAHIDALNSRDEAALAATLHFPHYRLSGTGMTAWDTPERYFEDFRARAGSDWSSSEFTEIKTLNASADKVHLDAKIIRYRANGDAYQSFRSLWVITCDAGRWAARLRSSFAPQ